MCAISGMINLPASEKTVRQMLETMHRRGPDDRGVYREKGCTLIHGRLAIIDPEGGRQPMTLAWAGEEYTLVYNGELYNTEQLRGELSVLGHSFLGHSDTEVLLHAYAQFGAECVEKLNGIFAFAVWEKRRGRLFLARDRIGVKPLFYKKHDGGLLFASEIKTILTYPTVRAELDKRGYFLSSANSINWGRILPQVVYYISAYCDLVRDGAITMGDKVNFCVPTGNFGDILAAYYAKRMGLPVNKLICASNSNNVLTDFLRTGIYDRNRPFHTTISPSMDILISSNLERLLFDLSGENDAEIRMYMDALGSAGRYQVSDNIKAKLDDAFWGGCCSEEETEETIRRYWQDHNYLIDPHTAVAAEVLAQYRVASGDETPAVVVSTASPYKFCGSVLTAIGETPCGDGLELLDQLHAASGVTVPRRLAELKGKSRRFDKTVEKQAMEQAVLDFLK